MSQSEIQLLSSSSDNNKKTFKDRMKLTLSGLSGAYMLPISLLVSIAIFLSLGSFLESLQPDSALSGMGVVIKNIAYPALQIVPLLFCFAFALSFCKGDSTCVWCSVIAYCVFISTQGVFIKEETGQGFRVLFGGAGRDSKIMKNLVDRNLGYLSLNTSIFGSFVIGGLLMPFLQRNYSNVQLKGPFAFFSGKRLLPLLSCLGGAILSLVFLVFWPWLGQGCYAFGNWLSKTPYGIDSFFFGLVEKSLIPTGLHHMFYAPLWFSPMGGDAISKINELVTVSNGTVSVGSTTTSSTTVSAPVSDVATTTAAVFQEILNNPMRSHAMWQGDALMGLSIISLPSNSLPSNSVTVSNQTFTIFDFFKDKLGLNVGRFTQGKFPIMQFCLPAAAVGMSLATDNPRATLKGFVPGIMSSFVLGITEPIEFTFLFSAPKLFYGFHAVMCGVSFMLMNIFGAHVTTILSGGIVEMFMFGILQVGKGTKFYMYFLVGIILAPIYLAVFYTVVKKGILNITSPEESSSASASSSSKVPTATRKLALALGGWENISKMSNCASRLRYDIVDKSKVNEDALKSAGVIAAKWVGDNHLQAIVGPKAESINQEMIKWNGEKL